MESETLFTNSRPNLVQFERKFRIPEADKPTRSITTLIQNYTKSCNVKTTILRCFPFIETLVTYDVKGYLPNDFISGLIVGVIMIPQGLANAALSTLPPIVGLYMSFFSSMTYFLFGTSRHLSCGCVAIVSLMMADLLEKYDNSEQGIAFVANLNQTLNGDVSFYEIRKASNESGEDNSYGVVKNMSNNVDDYIADIIMARRIEVASGVSVLAGLVFVVASRLGFSHITTIMSNSLVTGFTVGIAFHVVSSQLKEVFGISVHRRKGTGSLFVLWFDISEHLPETNVVVLSLTVACLIVMYIVKKYVNERYKHRMRIPIPIEICVVIIGILVSIFTHLHRDHDVHILGKVPVGIPKPKFPDFSLMKYYIEDALVIIIVSHAQSLAMAKTLALEHDYPIDSKQEMLANGLNSLVSGLFSGYIPSASVSRSVVQGGTRGKTQVASLFAAGLVLLVIMVIGPYIYHLPTCVMSAIILVNLRGMFLKLLLIPSEWRASKYDCAVWVFTCASTVILETGVALLISVGFSIFLLIVRSVLNPLTEIGQIQASDTDVELRSLENYRYVKTVKGVKLIKVKNPIYFFNSERFISAIHEITRINPNYVKMLKGREHDEGTPILEKMQENEADIIASRLINLKVLILDLSEVTFVDIMGVQALDLIIREYDSIGIDVLVSSVPETVFDILESTGFCERRKEKLFLNIQNALIFAGGVMDK